MVIRQGFYLFLNSAKHSEGLYHFIMPLKGFVLDDLQVLKIMGLIFPPLNLPLHIYLLFIIFIYPYLSAFCNKSHQSELTNPSLACYCHLINSVNTEVSLAVHRVGPTLLLDYLDVPALISYASEVG